MGLAALMGSTTWAVALVSIWLVPVYLLLMVLIFATPQAERAESRAKESRTEHSSVEAGESAGIRERIARRDGRNPSRPTTCPGDPGRRNRRFDDA